MEFRERVKWTCKRTGKQVSKSSQHNDLFIIEDGGGMFHTVSSSVEIMKRKYPPR